MYKILLVDDERLELNTLKNYIDWKKVGIDVVYTANNGLQALDLALFRTPDIVITDIRMPVMSGIDFARQLREKNKKVKIVFLTGYDEMDFIREAFKLSATDYILKPFLVEDVEKVVEEILRSLEKEHSDDHSRIQAERKMIDDLFKVEGVPEETLREQFLAVENVPAEEFFFGVVALYGKAGNPPGKEFFYAFPEIFYYIELQDMNLLLLKTSVESADVAERMADYMRREGIELGMAYMKGRQSLASARNLRKLFERTVDAGFYLKPASPVPVDFLLDQVKQPEPGEEQVRELHKLRRDITLSLSHGDEGQCFQELEHYYEVLGKSGHRVFRNGIQRLFHHINDELVLENEELSKKCRSGRYGGKVAALAEEANHYWQIREGLEEYVCAILAWHQSMQENANYRVVLYVEDYIEEHYGEPFTIDEMASGIGLSPNYVRSIFKNSSGMSIKNYLTEFRMDKACKLLKNTANRVNDVARMVGYDNVSYFCAMFQKRFGKTPNEWRRGL